jgi:phage gp36-like protein
MTTSPYATYDDVVKRYNPLLTMVGTGSTEVSCADIASIYISDAEGLINAYIGAKYQTPVIVEPLITRLAADLAIYKVLEDRASRVPEIASKRYTDACSILAMLRDGKMVLSGSQTIVATGDWEAYSSTSSYHPVFSPVLRDVDQRADSHQIDDDRNERVGDVDGFLN